MQACVWRLRTEAQDVVVWHIVRDGYQVSAARCCVFEGEVLATRQLSHGLGYVAFDAVFGGEERHPRQSHLWEQVTCAFQRLNAALTVGVPVGIAFVAH